jgi:hypothetical protein
MLIDHSSTELKKVMVHHVGNRTNGEELNLSKTSLNITAPDVELMLFKYFLSAFNNPEFFSFSFSNKDFRLNPLYSFAQSCFEGTEEFEEVSKHIAKYLFEISTHPQIKSGDLFIAFFTDVQLGEQTCNMIGIFKSETRQAFLKLDKNKSDYQIESIEGINVDKIDKGCLIFNTEKDQGYRVCMVDKSNKSAEAQYWKDSFLQVQACSDEFHQTKEFLNITKHFVTQKLDEEFEVTKADKIDLLNRSVAYFKTHETFDKEEFEEQVLQDSEVIKSFRSFDHQYREEHELEIQDSFDISNQAVKKQARIFKSVLKLDKNFHIYIHGNRNMIEQGVEQDGRKFYKIYYNEEA